MDGCPNNLPPVWLRSWWVEWKLIWNFLFKVDVSKWKWSSALQLLFLQALMQHLNRNKILMPELKRCWPVITAWFSEWFNSEFVFDFFVFVFVFVCVQTTFLQGLVHVLAIWGRVLSSCEETQNSQGVGGNVVGDGGKCLCLRARAATFSGWQGSLQQQDVVHQTTSLRVTWRLRWKGVNSLP